MKKECFRINSPSASLRAIDACMNFNVKDRIAQISRPTLVISGREDVMSPIHLAEQIHRSIPGTGNMKRANLSAGFQPISLATLVRARDSLSSIV
jgi:pimeloyl-ACP methyl ester carboxylesterase